LVAFELARHLRDSGHELTVLTLSDYRRAEHYVVAKIPVDCMPNRNVYNQFSTGKRSRLVKILFGVLDTLNPLVFLYAMHHLRHNRVDVLCSHNLKGLGPAVWLAAKALRIPIVHVVHDYWLICPTSTMFRRGMACASCCGSCQRVSKPKARLSKVVSHVVGVSKFALDQHVAQGFFVGVNQSVIHNGRAPLDTVPREPVKRHVPFRVGFIGRVDATKGITEFFKSVVAAQTPDLEVHVAGRDNDGVLQALIRTHPELNVVDHGFVDPRAFYEVVDLIVVSSMWHEPFATVSFEPWEFYKPSIAFAVGGLPEVYAPFPELTVPRGDVIALGALIRRFASDTEFYDDAARRCRERRNEFLPHRQVREYERVLLSVRRSTS
jgi:glycosyltransferase involved in cell wall biosynthesis